jgi:protein-disulfide isomerase
MVALESNMPKIWLMLAALAVAASAVAGAPASRAESAPTITSEDRVLGKADAPITIFEYASLTCPHCAAFEAEKLPKLKQEWIETGKAKLVFRNFPFDKAALDAAILARCAPPERYYAFLEVLFKDQRVWAGTGEPEAALSRYARLGGVSQQQFDACLQDKALNDAIVAERFTAEKDYGVNSTPTFFINGTKVVGDVPWPEFEKALTTAMPKS